MLPEFEFWPAKSLEGALEKLAHGGGEVLPIAGGTNLIVELRGGRHAPKALLNIEKLRELRRLEREDGWIVADGAITLAEVLDSPLTGEQGGSLREAARTFASPLVRNRATLGGNLADGSPAADSAPPLLALDAEVELASCAGVRRLPLSKFFLNVGATARRPDELITALRWPAPNPRTAFGYTKVGLRKADAISVASVAIALEAGKEGHCRKARIALGSIAPTPLRAVEAEALLEGEVPTPALIGEAARLAGEAASPISDIRGTAGYRRHVVTVLVRRLVEEAARALSLME